MSDQPYREKALVLYDKIRKMHAESYAALMELREHAKTPSSLEELSDIAYALKKAHDLVHDLKKELDGTGTLLERTVCLIHITTNQLEPIRTKLATGSPNVKQGATIPSVKKDPDAFYALCEGLGLSKAAAEHDVFRLHWPGVVEYLTELVQKGEPLPEGLDPSKTYPVYSLRHTPARGVDLDEHAGLVAKKYNS